MFGALTEIGCGAETSPVRAGSAKDPATMQHNVDGRLSVDNQPARDIEVALLDTAGNVVATTRSDDAGHFAFAAAGSAVVAKLRGSVPGAAFSRVGAPGAPIALAATTQDAVTLTTHIELPVGASPVDWFDVEVTPSALTGIPDDAVAALTLDGVGPARWGSYMTLRVTGTSAVLKLKPGSWRLKISHIVEHGKMTKPPPSWATSGLVAQSGTKLEAELGAVRIDLAHDTEVRVTMQPVAN